MKVANRFDKFRFKFVFNWFLIEYLVGFSWCLVEKL